MKNVLSALLSKRIECLYLTIMIIAILRFIVVLLTVVLLFILFPKLSVLMYVVVDECGMAGETTSTQSGLLKRSHELGSLGE